MRHLRGTEEVSCGGELGACLPVAPGAAVATTQREVALGAQWRHFEVRGHGEGGAIGRDGSLQIGAGAMRRKVAAQAQRPSLVSALAALDCQCQSAIGLRTCVG